MIINDTTISGVSLLLLAFLCFMLRLAIRETRNNERNGGGS